MSLASRLRRSLSVLGLSLLLFGCTRNAILEVELELPPGPADRYAVVQFETGDVPFDSVWQRPDDYDGAVLMPTAQLVTYSVISESSDTHVRMKVNFCTTPDCSGIDDAPDRVPAVWFDVPQSLYVGHRTRWAPTIDALPIDPPTAPITVDRCDIEGCIEATGGTTTFCRLDGRHYCE